MERVLVLDFGGQYDQLIARRIRELHVRAEIEPYTTLTTEEIRAAGYKGIVFTGGPNSVNDTGAPHFDPALLEVGIPILGICYGAQLLAYMAGGGVSSANDASEYGKTEVKVCGSPLFGGIPEKSICWMSHTDYISRLPEGFRVLAETAHCPCAAMGDERRDLYGVQFHPEVTHTRYGTHMLRNFLFDICRCRGDWHMDTYAAQLIAAYREELAGKKVLLALSGGVDSSVAAALLHKAIGNKLICVFVDHGLLRKGEGDFVEKTFRERMGESFLRVNAQERFLQKLAGVTEPEKKRKIIGEEFIHTFEQAAGSLGEIDVLAQGTIYPDIIESGKGDAAAIKSHHNVGGLPDVMSFEKIVEPLKDLFKDEVRRLGTELGIPDELVWRQPFPGPGLAVRIIGEVTKEKLSALQEADAIFREEVGRAGKKEEHGEEENGRAEGTVSLPDQYFAVLTDTRSVGVMGDARTYGYTVALRAVTTDDFMTAEWARLPYEVLEKASSRITNEVAGISRVVYDISSKPPSTVEWE